MTQPVDLIKHILLLRGRQDRPLRKTCILQLMFLIFIDDTICSKYKINLNDSV